MEKNHWTKKTEKNSAFFWKKNSTFEVQKKIMDIKLYDFQEQFMLEIFDKIKPIWKKKLDQ